MTQNKKSLSLINTELKLINDKFISDYNGANYVNLFKHTIDLSKDYWIFESYDEDDRITDYLSDEDKKKQESEDNQKYAIAWTNQRWGGIRTKNGISFPLNDSDTYVLSMDVKIVRLNKDIPQGNDHIRIAAWFVDQNSDYDHKNDSTDHGVSLYNWWIYGDKGLTEEWNRAYFIINKKQFPNVTSFNGLRVECYVDKDGIANNLTTMDKNIHVHYRKPMLVKGKVFTSYYPNMEGLI